MRQPWTFSTALGLMALLALTLTAPAARAAGGTGWLGVTMQTLDDRLREGIGYDGDGVLVNSVESGSPADRAGVRRGDVITTYNSRNVTGQAALANLVADSAPGQLISLGLWRDGRRQTLSVRLATRTSDSETRSPMRMRMGSGDADDDDDGDLPAPPRAPRAPMPPMAPMAPRMMMRMDRGMQGMSEVRRALGALDMAGLMGRARLGVQVEDLDESLAGRYGAPDAHGVLVSGVNDDTPASRAGFRRGDVIVKVGDRSVDDAQELRDALRDRPAGRVDVTVLRRGEPITLTPELEAREHTSESFVGPSGRGWSKQGPGEWHFKGPNAEKRIIINDSRDRDDDGDDDDDSPAPQAEKHIIIHRSGGGEGSHMKVRVDGDDDAPMKVRVERDSDSDAGQKSDDEDHAAMRRQIDELERQIAELKQQLATPTPAPKPKPVSKRK